MKCNWFVYVFVGVFRSLQTQAPTTMIKDTTPTPTSDPNTTTAATSLTPNSSGKYY